MKAQSYIAIDLKSFYASVECIQRGLDPMITNLVVADPSPHRQNHLPCGLPFSEILRHSRQAAAV